MAEETEDFFADFEAEEPKEIPSVTQKNELTPEEKSDPNLIDHLKEDEFFDDFRPSTEADDDALLDQNQGVIDKLVQKGVDRFTGDDVEDPFAVPRAVGIMAGSIAAPLLANQYLPPTTPPPVRGLVSTGASLFGTTLGAVSPELALQIAEDVSLIEPGTRARIGLSATDLQTVVQGELLIDSAFLTGFTVLRQIGKLTGRMLTTGGVLTKEGREALGLVKAADEKFGIQMLPVQVRDRTIARGFLAIFGNFPFTTPIVKKRAKIVDAQAQKALQDLGPRIAPLANFSELSLEIMTKSKRYFRAVSNKFDIAYTRLYDRAEAMGVRVAPKSTSEKARSIIEMVDKANASFAIGGPKAKDSAGAVTNRFMKFLRKSFIPLEFAGEKGKEVTLEVLQESGKPFVKLLPDKPANIALLDLKQMDGLTTKIDEFMSTLDKTSGQDALIRDWATQLKLAIKKDMIENVSGKNMGDAQAITRSFRALDEEFSLTMSQVFETATANRFGAVKRGGLRGRGALREATRTPVDQLAKTVINLDSPQAVQELRTLTGAKTFKRVVGQVMNDAVEKSMKSTEGSGGALKQFNTEAFIKQLGLKKGFGSRRAAIDMMLKTADSPFKMKDLDVLVTALQKIEGLPIPDVATFVARRAILGGWKSALGSFMGSAGAVASLTGNITSLFLLSATFIGGAKFFSRLISKPETAMSFMRAMDETASTAVRRNAYARAMRTFVNDLREEDPQNTDIRMSERFEELLHEIDDNIGFEGSFTDQALQKGRDVLDLNDPAPPAPEIDISDELEEDPSFSGDQVLP